MGRVPFPCCVPQTWVTPGENGAAAACVYPPRNLSDEEWKGYQQIFPLPAAVMCGGISWPRCGAVRQLGGLAVLRPCLELWSLPPLVMLKGSDLSSWNSSNRSIRNVCGFLITERLARAALTSLPSC